mmetsp:Transcript_13238/g.43872  ORF Transcript_13238/g.43872 Transcript_13238/m.43872 type:complete len:478 (+) Transcript_13238:2673-4106(+)
MTCTSRSWPSRDPPGPSINAASMTHPFANSTKTSRNPKTPCRRNRSFFEFTKTSQSDAARSAAVTARPRANIARFGVNSLSASALGDMRKVLSNSSAVSPSPTKPGRAESDTPSTVSVDPPMVSRKTPAVALSQLRVFFNTASASSSPSSSASEKNVSSISRSAADFSEEEGRDAAISRRGASASFRWRNESFVSTPSGTDSGSGSGSVPSVPLLDKPKPRFGNAAPPTTAAIASRSRLSASCSANSFAAARFSALVLGRGFSGSDLVPSFEVAVSSLKLRTVSTSFSHSIFTPPSVQVCFSNSQTTSKTSGVVHVQCANAPSKGLSPSKPGLVLNASNENALRVTRAKGVGGGANFVSWSAGFVKLAMSALSLISILAARKNAKSTASAASRSREIPAGAPPVTNVATASVSARRVRENATASSSPTRSISRRESKNTPTSTLVDGASSRSSASPSAAFSSGANKVLPTELLCTFL